jgi:hypothetical protein
MSLTYDTINQLTGATGPWAARRSATTPLATSPPTTSAYRREAIHIRTTGLLPCSPRPATVLFTYDGYGNVTNDGLHQFQFDDSSNLVCVDCLAASKIAYAYDGNNRRVSRTQNGVTTYYVHGSEGRLLLEYTPTGTTVEHIYLQGKRIATKTLP